MAQLQNDAEALSKARKSDNFEIIDVTFRRLREEQLKLQEEAWQKMDVH